MSKRVLIMLLIGVLTIVGSFFLLKYEVSRDLEQDPDPVRTEPEPDPVLDLDPDPDPEQNNDLKISYANGSNKEL